MTTFRVWLNEEVITSKEKPKVFNDVQNEAKEIALKISKELTKSSNKVMKKHNLKEDPWYHKFLTKDQGVLSMPDAMGVMVANYLVATKDKNTKFK